jgi:hypothetical protein
VERRPFDTYELLPEFEISHLAAQHRLNRRFF